MQETMGADVDDRSERLLEIRQGLAAGQFCMYFQPVVDVRSRGVTGFEALMRWRKLDGSVVGPDGFAIGFEEPDIACQLGELSLNQTLAQMRCWLRRRVEFGRVAVNLCSAQLLNGDFAGATLAKLARWRVPARRLTLEITETVPLGPLAGQVAQAIRRLHRAGIAISLDDFGTGYACLAHLRQFPIDHLKIDKSFTQDEQDDVIVRALISVACDLGMKVIAEGVERADQFYRLSRHGCDQVQGYYFARPMPAAEVGPFLRNFTGLPAVSHAA